MRWGSFRNLQPFNRDFGAYVGTAVDRYYIEKFLHSQATFIKGNVLEIAETRYTEKFASGEYKAHALHLKKTGSENEIVGDLVTGKGLVSESFDCAIVTQTLPFIYDFRSAINNLKRILKPNGVLLATLSGISQVSALTWIGGRLLAFHRSIFRPSIRRVFSIAKNSSFTIWKRLSCHCVYPRYCRRRTQKG